MLHQPHRAVDAAGFVCPPQPTVGGQAQEQLLTCPQPLAQSLAATGGGTQWVHVALVNGWRHEWMEAGQMEREVSECSHLRGFPPPHALFLIPVNPPTPETLTSPMCQPPQGPIFSSWWYSRVLACYTQAPSAPVIRHLPQAHRLWMACDSCIRQGGLWWQEMLK